MLVALCSLYWSSRLWLNTFQQTSSVSLLFNVRAPFSVWGKRIYENLWSPIIFPTRTRSEIGCFDFWESSLKPAGINGDFISLKIDNQREFRYSGNDTSEYARENSRVHYTRVFSDPDVINPYYSRGLIFKLMQENRGCVVPGAAELVEIAGKPNRSI